MNDEKNEKVAVAQPFPRITQAFLESRIKRSEFIHDGLFTVCILTLDNGYKVAGVSACAARENYNVAIGHKVAHQNAVDQLWPLYGFRLCDFLHEKYTGESLLAYDD